MLANNKKTKSVFFGAALLAVGGILSRLIGAAYRIPLLSILSAEGMGLYQLIFPLYLLLLTISSTAIPVVVSINVARLRAGGYESKTLINKCIKVFGIIGGALSLLLVGLSGIIAAYLDSRIALSLILIAPSIFLVAIISVLRGGHQGCQNMLPTALSQIVEQVVKVPLGILFALVFMPNLQLAVGALALSITLSELAALVFLLLYKNKGLGGDKCQAVKLGSILAGSGKITLGAIVMPLSQIIDSFMVIKLISVYSQSAAAMYGLLSGGVYSLINLPVAMCAALPTALIPIIAASRKKSDRDVSAIMFIMLSLASFFCGIFYFLGGDIINVLYGGLGGAEKNLMTELLKLSSVNVVLLTINQLFTSLLQATKREGLPAISIAIGSLAKIIVGYFLLTQPQINIFGAVISANLCYLLASIVNLVYIIRVGDNTRFSTISVVLALFLATLAALAVRVASNVVGGFLGLIIGGIFGTTCILLGIQIFGGIYAACNRFRREKRRYFTKGIFSAQDLQKNNIKNRASWQF